MILVPWAIQVNQVFRLHDYYWIGNIVPTCPNWYLFRPFNYIGKVVDWEFILQNYFTMHYTLWFKKKLTREKIVTSRCWWRHRVLKVWASLNQDFGNSAKIVDPQENFPRCAILRLCRSCLKNRFRTFGWCFFRWVGLPTNSKLKTTKFSCLWTFEVF